MKCPNCSGEVDSQSTRCPYCGSVYEPGALFQLEIAEKMARNKLLPKFILKSRTPDMVQMVLTRIVISFSLATIVFLVAGFMIYLAGDNVGKREIREGSYAEVYLSEEDSRIESETLRENMNQIVVAADTGQEIPDYIMEAVLRNAYSIMVDEEENPLIQEQMYAFLYGYLQMPEEEVAEFLNHTDSDYADYDYIESLARKLVERWEGNGE